MPKNAIIGIGLPASIGIHLITQNGAAIGTQSLIPQFKEGGGASETDEITEANVSEREEQTS